MYVVGECSLLPAVNYWSVVEPAVGDDAHIMIIVYDEKDDDDDSDDDDDDNDDDDEGGMVGLFMSPMIDTPSKSQSPLMTSSQRACTTRVARSSTCVFCKLTTTKWATTCSSSSTTTPPSFPFTALTVAFFPFLFFFSTASGMKPAGRILREVPRVMTKSAF